MNEQVYFYPNGSKQGFPVNSRQEILDILREKRPDISLLDIELKDEIYIVLVTFLDDVSWFAVGRTTGYI